MPEPTARMHRPMHEVRRLASMLRLSRRGSDRTSDLSRVKTPKTGTSQNETALLSRFAARSSVAVPSGSEPDLPFACHPDRRFGTQHRVSMVWDRWRYGQLTWHNGRDMVVGSKPVAQPLFGAKGRGLRHFREEPTSPRPKPRAEPPRQGLTLLHE